MFQCNDDALILALSTGFSTSIALTLASPIAGNTLLAIVPPSLRAYQDSVFGERTTTTIGGSSPRCPKRALVVRCHPIRERIMCASMAPPLPAQLSESRPAGLPMHKTSRYRKLSTLHSLLLMFARIAMSSSLGKDAGGLDTRNLQKHPK